MNTRNASFSNSKEGRGADEHRAKLAGNSRAIARRIEGGHSMRAISTRQKATRVVPSTTLVPINVREAAREFSAIVLPFSAGDLAQAAACTKEAAKGWKSGRSMPSATSLLMLGQQIPTVAKWIKAKLERGGDLPLESPQMLNAILDGIQKLASEDGPDGEAARLLLSKIARGLDG